MNWLRVCCIFGLALLTMGTVIQRKTAIQKTQTDPIAYEQKQKEEAEGKKGPPVPAFKLFPKERFFTEPPVEKGKTAVEPSAEEMEEREWGFWFEEGEEEFKPDKESDDTEPRFLDTPAKGSYSLINAEGSQPAVTQETKRG